METQTHDLKVHQPKCSEAEKLYSSSTQQTLVSMDQNKTAFSFLGKF